MIPPTVISNVMKEALYYNDRELTYNDWGKKGLNYLKKIISDSIKPNELSAADWLHSLAVTHYIMFSDIPLTIKSLDPISIADYIATNVPRWTLDNNLLLSTVPIIDNFKK